MSFSSFFFFKSNDAEYVDFLTLSVFLQKSENCQLFVNKLFKIYMYLVWNTILKVFYNEVIIHQYKNHFKA